MGRAGVEKKKLDTKCSVRNDKLMYQTCMAQPAEEQLGVLLYPTNSTSFLGRYIRTRYVPDLA